VESLRAALRALPTSDPLRLGVAALGTVPFEPFDEEGVTYFHLQSPPLKRGLRADVEQWRHGNGSDGPALAQAKAVVEAFQPDLIHVHGSERPMGLLAGMVDRPVLISLQGLLVVCSRFFFAGLPAAEVLRAAASVDFVKGRGIIHDRWNMQVAARRELAILGTCRYFAGRTEWDRAVVSVLNPGARYYHAGEVLRPEFYAARWQAKTNGHFRVYCTSGPATYKGLVNLLEAVAVLRHGDRRPVELRVSGQVMSTHMGPVMERTVRRLGLESVVSWLGPLGAAELVSELQAASVYVHPSLVDNSPNALAEAMMVGVPCVASAAGGVPSMISSGVDGLLCAPNDIYDMAGKLAAIEADDELAGRLGAAARSRGLERHHPESVAASTVEMYADILERHRRGQR
jgi:glycosyltransferase involved in cell wall biosynthesis